jgi:membrane associated rhomboid family serine protease
MANSSHSIREELSGVFAFIGAIWAVYLLSFALPAIDEFGVMPRRLTGLVGIPAMPFLHANLHHLVSNTIPLFVLLVLLAGSRAESWEVVVLIIGLSGLLLWIFGRAEMGGQPVVHVGASGLISGLTAFLILSGFLERRLGSLLVAVLVAFLYGGSLLLGVVPRFGSNISWDGHLCGAVAGGFVAIALTRQPRKRAAEPTLSGLTESEAF